MKTVLFTCMLLTLFTSVTAAEGLESAQHGYAKSGEIQIHYVTMGEGPLVVMLHGFPDYWYTWRKQMPALAKNFQVVAIDQRGYNKSGQPKGVEQYTLAKLAGDVRAVIQHFGRDKAAIVGHDWGGAVAWTFAMTHPEMTDKLVILNLPHPNGLRRELSKGQEQFKASAYARRFQAPDAAAKLNAAGLAAWVQDKAARDEYVKAFQRSSFEGMLNYYKANYPRAPANPTARNSDGATEENLGAPPNTTASALPKIKCPVLMIHGLKDKALLPAALNDTWNWVERDLTLVTIPDAAHFVQQDAAERVTRTIETWLVRQPSAK